MNDVIVSQIRDTIREVFDKRGTAQPSDIVVQLGSIYSPNLQITIEFGNDYEMTLPIFPDTSSDEFWFSIRRFAGYVARCAENTIRYQGHL